MRNKPKNVTPIMPKNTATPIACRISEPAPVEVTSGTTPIINAIEVIKIGRKRRRLASTAALKAVAPCISSSLANSTIKMAFLQASPTSTIRPICVKMLLSPAVNHTPVRAAKIPIGTIKITANGRVKLSY
ncbi:Uncharacterised protein [Acinetobacter baumannii]|nr:Uncharacterised protein [Acinetobacter baumannii]